MTLISAVVSIETRIKIALMALVLAFVCLVVLLTHAWGWSYLAICTLVFALSYPLCWLAWRVWHLWSSSIMRLTAYTQSLAMGESGISLAQQGKSELYDGLAREIALLHQNGLTGQASHHSQMALFSQLFEDLPIAVILFDNNYTLAYANHAAYALPDIGLLQGMAASDLGFIQQSEQIFHPDLGSSWRCQSHRFVFFEQTISLFTAIDISHELKQSEQAVQENLVRVLSHELRNTLTPMSSMTATLLSMEAWDLDQIRTVLERIRARSDGLLAFVQRFAEVAKIPEPKKEQFDIQALVEQTKVLLREQDSLIFVGQQNCYADPQLIAQVLMNLIKNAVESVEGRAVAIEVSFYQTGDKQYLSVSDNGMGFSNIENAITPLFTTKAHGAGIGLAFVESVTSKHGGKVKLSNQANGGAKVELSWPLLY